MHIFFSDFLCFDMSLLLLTVTLRGVSNKHCLLPFFSIYLMKLKGTCVPKMFVNKRYVFHFQKIEELQQENEKMKTAIGRLETSVSYGSK